MGQMSERRSDHTSERGSDHTSERKNNCWRPSFLSLGFTTTIGVHSISEEVVGFFLYGFPEDKYLCLLSLVIDSCACYSLREDPKIILLK